MMMTFVLYFYGVCKYRYREYPVFLNLNSTQPFFANEMLFLMVSVHNNNDNNIYMGTFDICLAVANELVSHLPLQMLLYFNMFYFPCWWFSAVFMLEVKVGRSVTEST